MDFIFISYHMLGTVDWAHPRHGHIRMKPEKSLSHRADVLVNLMTYSLLCLECKCLLIVHALLPGDFSVVSLFCFSPS
jgi:hypothetical protein